MDRKAINFYKSYYEVAKELPLKYQQEFIMAVLEYQFTGIEPTISKPIKLAWISQKHSMDRQLQGFIHGKKGGAPLGGKSNPPLKGTSNQVQGQEKEQVQEVKTPPKKIFVPPTLEEFKLYFKQEGYSEEKAVTAWKGYNEAEWHDSRGSKIKNWKQKCQHVWFKPENRGVDPNKPVIKEGLIR